MDRITTFQIRTGVEDLRQSIEAASPTPELFEPLQAIVQKLSHSTATGPVAVYVFSNDASAELRDHFAVAVAQTMQKHIESTVVVDCDFLHVGMHGFVPQHDALGFLDLLLYGSSYGLVTQKTETGVNVIGAGSFPVSKRVPFVMTAFEDAARRLTRHAKVLIFTGPVHDDDGALHPMIGTVNIPILVRAGTASAHGQIDPVEEQIVQEWDVDLISVRATESDVPMADSRVSPPPAVEPEFVELTDDPVIADRDEAPTPPPPSPPAEPPSVREPEMSTPDPVAPVPPVVDTHTSPPPLDETVNYPGPSQTATPYRGPASDGGKPLKLDYRESRYTSLIPRITTVILAIAIIVFVAWWFLGQRGAGDTLTDAGSDPVTSPVTTPVTSPGSSSEPDQALKTPVDTVATAIAPRPTEVPPATDSEATRGGSGAAVLIGSEDIIIMEDVENDWPGYYLIHISSFRESIKARQDAAYLKRREFSVFIVFLDLDTKGKWYRVYAGPFRTRGEAVNVKKSLDDVPSVRFTRISKVAG